jgi:hypothetical protein
MRTRLPHWKSKSLRVHRFEPGLVDFGVECIDISGMLLQGDGTVGYEVS